MQTFSGSHLIEPDTFSLLIADMGTTNIVVSNGKEKARIKNPQTRYGADVISRILYSINNGSDALKNSLHTGLFDAFSAFFAMHQSSSLYVSHEDSPVFPVQKIVLTGNTVMMHFLAGLDTSGMALFPFTPASFFGYECQVIDLFPNLDFSTWKHLFNQNTPVYLPPCIEAFVGADLVCASVGCGVYGNLHTPITSESFLVIDIGTNTEILLSHNNEFYACSTAAGPAFEGGNVKSTLRGSELLHALHVMLSQKQMDETGMILTDKTLLCQSDIRQLQLAKAAISAAVETLLHEAGVSSKDIAEVFLCGAFGTNCIPKDIERTGLLNAVLSQKITVKEMAVISGAAILAKSDTSKKLTSSQVTQTNVIQLANNSFFAKKYIDCMNF